MFIYIFILYTYKIVGRYIICTDKSIKFVNMKCNNVYTRSVPKNLSPYTSLQLNQWRSLGRGYLPKVF